MKKQVATERSEITEM